VRALQELGLSQRAACRITGCARSVAQYRIRRSNDPHMIERLKAIAAERRRFGYRRLGLMLRREGIVANHERVYRIYRDLALQLRPRRKRGVRKPDRMIKRHGRWKSTAMLERYIEDGTRWDDNASVGIGL